MWKNIEKAIREDDPVLLKNHSVLIKQHIKEHPEWLVMAAEEGHLDVVTYLMGLRGVDSNAHNSNNTLALTIAAANDHDDVVRFLIVHGANVNGILQDGSDLDDQHEQINSPFTAALENYHWGIATFLASQGADVNRRSLNGMTAFELIAHHPDATKKLQYLINKGFDVTCYDGINSPLYTLLVTYYNTAPEDLAKNIAALIHMLIVQPNVETQLEQLANGCEEGYISNDPAQDYWKMIFLIASLYPQKGLPETFTAAIGQSFIDEVLTTYTSEAIELTDARVQQGADHLTALFGSMAFSNAPETPDDIDSMQQDPLEPVQEPILVH